MLDGNQWPTLNSEAITIDGHAPITGSATLELSSNGLCDSCELHSIRYVGLAYRVPRRGRQGAGLTSSSPGYWVAGDVTQDLDLPFTGSASYAGQAIGNVANNLDGKGWQTYTAQGNLGMTWNFATRSGEFSISRFDTKVSPDGLAFGGPMCAPGVAGCGTSAGNHFGGPLSGKLPNGAELTGSAAGSFVNNGTDKAAGVIGNWGVANSQYEANGIFAGARK